MNDLRAVLEREVLPFVEKPMRYAGNELNAVRKDLSRVMVHGVFCFPDLYEIGMSHLGLQIIYSIVNKEPSWALSRSFHPWTDMEEKMRELRIPLYSLEYLTPLRKADWVGFTVQYELHATNILNMLDLAGIPLCGRDRGPGDPLIIAGGPCVANPEPLADFIDAFVIGDGEETVVRLCRIIEQAKREGTGRDGVLRALAAVKGVYVPSQFPAVCRGMFLVPDRRDARPVRAAKVPVLLDKYYPERPLVPLIDVVHHRLAVEVMRGCARGCRFCSAGIYYRPVRERDAAALNREIERSVTATGWRDVGLLSLSTADYSCLTALLAGAGLLKERCRIAFSLPSTRVDALTGEQFERVTAVSPVSSLTLAPEAGSERLRRAINKEFSDEAVFAAVRTLLDKGVQTIKLYFMIGLPTEDDRNIEAIAVMVRRIAGMARAASHRRRVNVSLSPFSPKPHTPFQREAMASIESLDRRSKQVKRDCAALSNVKISYRNARMTFLETVIARGDRAVGAVIRRAWKQGARFDGWDEKFNFERWAEAARDASIDLARYAAAIPEGQELPWSIIDSGVSDDFLAGERERARTGMVTADCRHGTCANCGVCDAEVKTRHAAAAETPPLASPSAESGGKAPLPATHRHYRVIYRKGPEARFLGHLDMVAVFHRALVAAGFDLLYSRGFEPRPRIAFGPPLPFGITGDAEGFDMTVVTPVTGDQLRMNAMLPPGLRVVSVAPLDKTGTSLSASITAGRYRFAPAAARDPSEVRTAIDDALKSVALPVTVVRDGVPVTKDLRPLIRELHLEDPAAPAFEGELSMEPGATCRPAELLSVLFPGSRSTDFSVTRRACLVRKDGKLIGIHEGGA